MSIIYDDEIAMDSSDGQTPWRMRRLERVVGYCCAMSEGFETNLVQRIKSLHDHKGVLHVGWRTRPTKAEKAILAGAWDSLIGDGCDVVEHEW